MVAARADQARLRFEAATRTAAHHEARETALMWTGVASLLPEPEPPTLAEQIHDAARKTVDSWTAQDDAGRRPDRAGD